MSQGLSEMSGANSEVQDFYGGRMTEDRPPAAEKATSEAIDHLHRSLESCPSAEAESPDPEGLKVPLLAHQRRALAWLLWRETQKPCGGILADDMGLGKTLTMISLILTKKAKTYSSVVASKGTLIICPADLINHWKKEINRRVKASQLSVCLYHGPNREKRASALAAFDVVVTSYSLVREEIPVQKEEADKPKEADVTPPSSLSPLLLVSWDRVVLDEADIIKNPKTQTSMAVCQLKARARWAVTGMPIQNYLLDMYSLLKFLRCSPFDELKLWKAQVDNGSRRGRERLNLLIRCLLLRRTRDQLDAAGKPLVSLPDLKCEVHRLRLSTDEQAVYNALFAQFSQASNIFHILSLLLRLQQSCCHLSLLKETLDSSELNEDEIALPLEEQLNNLSLTSSPSGPDGVGLNLNRFPSRLFKKSSESTKISEIVSKLEKIREKNSDQKSVIVSQWTSMLRIVAVHLERIGLRYGIIDGDVEYKRRVNLVEEFNNNSEGPQVMLVSLRTRDGLSLIGGNHLFLIDMHWNPFFEDRACYRIYRVGQTKDVTIHRFECEGTVEEKISKLQLEKKKLAQNVLSGTGSPSTMLSLADLRIIFGSEMGENLQTHD